jgi:hypothetical protein
VALPHQVRDRQRDRRARAVAGRGGKSWYFVTVDYALGHALERVVDGDEAWPSA